MNALEKMCRDLGIDPEKARQRLRNSPDRRWEGGTAEDRANVIKYLKGLSVSKHDETVPCSWCGTPTRMTGTRHCDGCHELETRIRRDPDLARRMLNRFSVSPMSVGPRPYKNCWKSKDGRLMIPSQMETQHIISAGRMCYRVASKFLSERAMDAAGSACMFQGEMAQYYAEQAADELARRSSDPEVIKQASYKAWPVLQLMEDELKRRGVI